MAKCKVLAFLLCESASRGADGKVTLHGLFDRIVTPLAPRATKTFFVYYKIVVKEPCTIGLRIYYLNSQLDNEIQGDWRDSFSQLGPVQGIWALTTNLFNQPGNYALKLEQVMENSEPVGLADTLMVVDQEGE